MDFTFLDDLRDKLSNYLSYFIFGFIIYMFIQFGLLFLMLFHIIDIHSIVESMKTCVMAVRL